MTTIQDLFPSKYLKASDAEPELVLTIARIKTEKMTNRDGEEEIKPVIFFAEQEKGMVLNKTNANVLTDLFGETIENWTGQKITLCSVDVDAFGKIQKALRFRAETPTVNRAALLKRYHDLLAKAETIDVEGLDDFKLTDDADEATIIDAGKQLRALVAAAEAFA